MILRPLSKDLQIERESPGNCRASARVGMRTPWIPLLALFLAGGLLTRGAAADHVQFVVMFDEDGNAKILAGEGDSTKFMHALEPDPTPGENPNTNVLTYWYNSKYKQNYMPGDVIIKDGKDTSDVIRFIHDPKHADGPGASAILFYSDNTPGEPKENDNDAGLPKTTPGKLPPLDEVSLANIDWKSLGVSNPPDLSGKFGAVYLAHGQPRGSGKPDEPGSLIGVPDNVNAYIFISDSDPPGGKVPEPSSLLLLGLGITGAALASTLRRPDKKRPFGAFSPGLVPIRSGAESKTAVRVSGG